MFGSTRRGERVTGELIAFEGKDGYQEGGRGTVLDADTISCILCIPSMCRILVVAMIVAAGDPGVSIRESRYQDSSDTQGVVDPCA